MKFGLAQRGEEHYRDGPSCALQGCQGNGNSAPRHNPVCTGALGIIVTMALVQSGSPQVTTSQYDNFRTGATLHEKALTPANVNAAHFGKVGAFKVDGAVYAQPLFMPSLDLPGKGKHDVLFVATEHDSVYAFDAERPNDPPLWHVSFVDEKSGITTVPNRAVHCPFIRPEVGITSTPVIDPTSGTLFVLARTMKGNEYFQHLHALDVTTGAEKLGGPRQIAASVPGRAADSVKGQVEFNPLRENPRTALLLVKGQVVLTWASSCDVEPYHGWIIAYDANTLKQTAVFNVTPDGSEGGIWTSDTGLGADAAGNIFVPTANGTFNANQGGHDYGESVLKLALAGGNFIVLDYFTPYNQDQLNGADADLGSSGPLLLPDQPGVHSHLLLQPTKGGAIYVLDRDRLGKFRPEGNDNVQTVKMPGSGYGAMAYWNGHIFFACSDDYLRDYRLVNGKLEPAASTKELKFDNPGATPSVSADNGKNAVVWAIATKTWDGPDRPAILYAFDANDISHPIYSSERNSARDRAALATRFVIPVVANGHVYFGTRSEVEMYGLLH